MITSLALHSYRNYEREVALFSPGINLIHGENGQGKSNLLEALYFFIAGRSFRTSRLSEVIRQGDNGFSIETLFSEQGIQQRLQIAFYGERKQVTHNTASLPSFAGLFGLVRGVLFAPHDHLLISGPPATRRRFLDLHLVQIDPLYVHHLGRYCGALRQRNALLRNEDSESLEAWEEQMAISATYLREQREAMVEELNVPLREAISALSRSKDTPQVILKALPEKPSVDTYRKLWKQQRRREFASGYTLFGPHRDELLILQNGYEARIKASEGQIRSLALSLRIAEWRRLTLLSPEPPLKLIDDFGVQLDASRRSALTELLGCSGQTFITSPDPITWPQEHQQLHVSGGRIRTYQPA